MEEQNDLAKNLRKTKEFDEIRLLCSENGISGEIAEEFIEGDRLFLVENRHQETNQKEDSVEEFTEPQSDIGKVIESIERGAFERSTKEKQALQSPTWKAVREKMKENMKGDEVAQRISDGHLLQGPLNEDSVQMGTASLKDILCGIPKPTEDEIKAAEKEQEAPVVYTVEDARKKLEEELKIYKDGDSKYVVNKLIELCNTDDELLNAIMLPQKSYDKAFQYFYEKSRTVGYKMPRGNMIYLDNDAAVKLSVEYFKRNDAQVVKKKASDKKPVVQRTDPSPKKPEEPKKKKNELDGQMSLFDI